MNVISLCVLGVFAVIGSLALKNYNKEIAALLVLSAVVMMSVAAFPALSQLLQSVNELTSSANMNDEYISVLIKSLGICYITQISVNICTENGSRSIASQLEIAGKLVILILAVPVYNDLIELVTDFLM